MTHLSAEVRQLYQQQGYCFPIQVMSEEEAARYCQIAEDFAANHPQDTKLALGNKTHLRFPEFHDLIADPRILDAVEDTIGPNILCWASAFFWKRPHDDSFVSWHQDSTYWGLEPLDIVTAWLALTPSNRANGCMRVIPGTQHLDQIEHHDTFVDDNMLSRGQEVNLEVNDDEAVDIELQAGQMSLHHVKIVHGSQPNPSPLSRMGFVVRYFPPYVRQFGARTSAILST